MDWTRFFAHAGLGTLISAVAVIVLVLAEKYFPRPVTVAVALVLIVLGFLAIGAGFGVWLGI